MWALFGDWLLTADAAVGARVAGLKARGRWQQAVVAVTADHGEGLWDHCGFEHGHALWSALTHVPMVLKAPGVQPSTVDSVVEHIDLSHTLLKLAGAAIPQQATGQDLRSVAADRPALRAALQENCIHGVPRWSTGCFTNLTLPTHLRVEDVWDGGDGGRERCKSIKVSMKDVS